ncbi:MAG: fasciclin [Azospira oryzae]|nr:MAG: fasciclin [Azospira oryzae]
MACSKPAEQAATVSEPVEAGQSSVQDDESQKNIVQTAIASPDHKTLVAALKAASYVDALANAGPFTVFAPNDQGFAKLPAGTVEDLVKPENKDKLQNILEYHVYVGVIRESMVNGSMNLNQVNGKNVTLSKEGERLKVNGNEILATVTTSNGIIYVIDNVLLPPQ